MVNDTKALKPISLTKLRFLASPSPRDTFNLRQYYLAVIVLLYVPMCISTEHHVIVCMYRVCIYPNEELVRTVHSKEVMIRYPFYTKVGVFDGLFLNHLRVNLTFNCNDVVLKSVEKSNYEL